MISPSWSGGSWLFSLFLAVVLADSSPGQAAELIALTNVWQYEQSGTDLGTAWRLTNYDDSAWPAGPGALARDDTPLVQAMTGTVLDRQGTNGQFKLTDYFRTRFIAPTLQPGWM